MSRFFDELTGGPLQIDLRRVSEIDYRLLRSFGYRDSFHDDPFVVPHETDEFTTDLASIPWFFAWLVPGQGSHLPAVLLHDGLVVNTGEGKTHRGPDLSRLEADRILRDAMCDLGTPVVRRWLIWTGVALATVWEDLRPRSLWRSLLIVTFGLIAVVGAIATLDLFDTSERVSWMGSVPELWWMGERGWWVELAFGLAGALVIPMVMAGLWFVLARRQAGLTSSPSEQHALGELWKAPAIGGVALAVLFHTTLAVVMVYSLYRILEAVIGFLSPD